MTRIAYLDCFSGIAGDMFLAACLDAGVLTVEHLEKLSQLGLGRVQARVEKIRRGPLAATHLRWELKPAPSEQPHRSWSEIRGIIEQSGLSDLEKRWALRIFEGLAEAEARVHGLPLEDVHFHEVGALDSILDVCGAAVAIAKLGVERWYASSINVGGGSVPTAHGRLPVPAPAALELLKGFSVYGSGERELVTPTGAAILRALEPAFELPPARWLQVGYGAGTHELEGQPNVLRLMVGEPGPLLSDTTVILETEVDDLAPELVPHVQQKLLDQGAKSASVQPITMKKGRPGLLIRVLCDASQVDRLAEVLFEETTTLGLVFYPVQRRKLGRRFLEVETPYGRVRVKLGLLGERVVNIAPEYEDCWRLAETQGVPLKEIYQAAVAAARQSLDR